MSASLPIPAHTLRTLVESMAAPLFPTGAFCAMVNDLALALDDTPPPPDPTEGVRERLEALGFVFPEYRPDGRVETVELRRVPRRPGDFARGRERAIVAAVER